jgi:hypothetical protein
VGEEGIEEDIEEVEEDLVLVNSVEDFFMALG